MECINCGGNFVHFYGDFHICENCKLFRNFNYSNKEELKVRLKDFMLSASSNKNTEKRRLGKAKIQIQNINENYHKKGNVYDVAAAGGFFMKVAKEDGWTVAGNEVSKSSIKWAKDNYGLDIEYGYFEDLDIPKIYDAVVFWNTLEHMHNPVESIKKTSEILVQGGLIYIRVPNRHVGNLQKYVQKLHSYEFNSQNLNDMLVREGFEKIFIKNVAEEESMDLLYKLK